MTPEQKAAYVVAQAALLNATMAQMTADNLFATSRGECAPYNELHFESHIQEFEATIGHNALMELFKD